MEDLARAAAAGDQAALNDLPVAIEPRVKRIVGRMLLHPQDAEEAAQDALLAVARHVEGFEGRSRFTTWLHAVAGNSARSTYRSLKRRAAEQPHDQLPAATDPRTTSVIAGCRPVRYRFSTALQMRVTPRALTPRSFGGVSAARSMAVTALRSRGTAMRR